MTDPGKQWGPVDPRTLTLGERFHSPESESDVPETIGKYSIVRRLAVGGMGEVYEAWQEEPVRRRVALKLIKWGMDTRQVVARFDSERQALALMNHPNIARVFEAGSTERGRPYFVMEFVRGVPITQYCNASRTSIRERLRLFIQVCEGMQHAHQKGVIHRDIKPSNVLVTIQDETPVPKIIDFGLAKAIADPVRSRSALTRMGQFIGTPQYMSPEQASVGAVDVDTRTDVYLLGMLLYELLAGALPFDFSGPQISITDMVQQITEREPMPPCARVNGLAGEAVAVARDRGTDVPGLIRQLRGDLDCITIKALQKDRAGRYPSANSLAADVLRHLRHEPIWARPPRRTYRMGKFVRRHKVGVAASALVFLAMAIGTAGATVGFLRATRSERLALAEATRAGREAETAKQVSEFLVGLFDVANPGGDAAGSMTVREVLDRGAEKIRQELQDQPEVQARLMDTMGRAYRSLGEYDRSRELLEQALSIRRRVLGDDHPEVARTLNSLALVLWGAGDREKVRALLEEALAIREKALGPNHAGVAKILNNLAILARHESDYERARVLYERSLGILETAFGQDHPDVAKTLVNLAILARNTEDHERALALYRRALAALTASRGPDHPDVAKCLNNLGALLEETGDFAGARESYRRSLEIRESVLGPSHPSVALTIHNMANLAFKTHEYAEADRLYRQAQRLWEQKLEPTHPYIAENLERHAELLLQTGDEATARRFMDRAAEIRESAGAAR